MSTKIKWILAALIALSVVVIAQATAVNNYFLPVIYVAPTLTPTPTKSPTPTPTQKPSDCINETFGVSSLKLCFTDIVYKPTTSPLDEWVTIKNLGSSAVDMEGWRISSDSSNKFDFPKFSLNTGQTVKVWTKRGTNSSNTLYMNRDFEFWNNNADCGYLVDDTRRKINSFCYKPGLFYAPVEE